MQTKTKMKQQRRSKWNRSVNQTEIGTTRSKSKINLIPELLMRRKAEDDEIRPLEEGRSMVVLMSEIRAPSTTSEAPRLG